MADGSGQRFAVLCQGHAGQRAHTEYRFRVRHCGGCEWTVQRRYLDLLNVHERLCAVFGSAGLPAFPPKQSTAADVMGALLGVSIGSRPDIISEREAAFQKYFDILCGRDDVVGTHIFQAALGVCTPEPVAQLRIKGWLPANSKGERALLDIRAEGQQMENSAVVEVYHIVARLVKCRGGESRLADAKIPAATVNTGAGGLVEGLPAGEQVELEACAENVLGRSLPVSIRLLVPRQSGSKHCGGLSSAAVEVGTSECSSSSHAYPASKTASAQDPHGELEQRRLELEQWWLKRRDEADREDAERQRQMADFQAQREALEREREELFQERRQSSTCSPASQSPRSQSALASPRLDLTDVDDQCTGAGRESATERSVERSEEEHRRAREDLRRERQELDDLLKAQEEVSAAREAEYAARAAALEEQQAALDRQRLEAEELQQQEQDLLRKAGHLARTEELLQAERLELQRSRANFAIVQAQVASMLDQAESGGAARVHRLDSVDGEAGSIEKIQVAQVLPVEEQVEDDEDIADPVVDSPCLDKVWSMDWTDPKLVAEPTSPQRPQRDVPQFPQA